MSQVNNEQTPIIIAAIDQSEMLESVVARAQHLATCLKGTLIVLHVVTEKMESLANASYGDFVLGSVDESIMDVEDAVRNKLALRLESVGVKRSTLELIGGAPAKAVQEQLKLRDASMLVVGQPKSRLGSVATSMAKHAACDVYIVRDYAS